MDKVYSGLAIFGKIQETIASVIITIVCVVFIILLFVYMNYKGKLDQKTIGTIISIDKSGNAQVQYPALNANGVQGFYTITIMVKNSKVGDTIELVYSKNSPNNAIRPVSTKMLWIVIAVLGAVIVASWIWTWLTFKYKPIAAAQGVGGIIDIVD